MADFRSVPRVAVVNEAFVKRYLSASPPIGHPLALRGNDLEIVGVVRDAVYESLREPPPPTVYTPFFARGVGAPDGVTLVIDAGPHAASVAPAILRLLQPKWPGVPVEVRALSAQVERSMVRERLMAVLSGGFGALALVLVSVGLYGLLACSVTQRTNEIGVRMALGAARGRVLRQVVGDAIRLVAAGVAIGVPAAWAASRLVSSMLFGLTPTDPATFAGASAVLGSSAVLASVVPAWRAARVDPMTALRQDR
jgi:ABC-type antimicrobial peptide transport system permease subunit